MRLATAILRWLFWIEGALFLLGTVYGIRSTLQYGYMMPWWLMAVGLVFGCGALAAAWGMQTSKRWGRVAGFVISAQNLFLFPYGTALGVYGVVVLWNKAAREQSPKKPGIAGSRVVMYVLNIAVMSAGLLAVDPMLRYLNARHVPHAPLWLLVVNIPLSLWFAVLIHELGHCAAAWAGGFQVVVIANGRMVLVRQDQRWQFRWARKLGVGGLAGIQTRTTKRLRERYLLFVAGGPIASLLLGLALVGLMFDCPGRPWQILAPIFGIAAQVSFSIFAGNAFPFRVKTNFTDGARFLQVWRRSREGERILMGLRCQTLRPRDIPLEWIQAGVAVPDGSKDHVYGCMRAYEHYLDCGDHAEAARWMDEWRELQRANPGGLHADRGLTEAAYFEARYRGNAAEARALLDAARRALRVERYTIQRSWAAVLLAEGKREESLELIAQARADLDGRKNSGHGLWEWDLLSDLERQVLPQPAPAVVAVSHLGK